MLIFVAMTLGALTIHADHADYVEREYRLIRVNFEPKVEKTTTKDYDLAAAYIDDYYPSYDAGGAYEDLANFAEETSRLLEERLEQPYWLESWYEDKEK